MSGHAQDRDRGDMSSLACQQDMSVISLLQVTTVAQVSIHVFSHLPHMTCDSCTPPACSLGAGSSV